MANAIIEESLIDDGRQSRKKTASTVRSDKKSRRCMPQVKALAISAFLFALITVLQVGAAKIAHSQALLMDCISMAVDSFTYMGALDEWISISSTLSIGSSEPLEVVFKFIISCRA